jgi:membrane protein DedA with SNARE-associated domain
LCKLKYNGAGAFKIHSSIIACDRLKCQSLLKVEGFSLKFRRSLERLKGKAPQLLVLAFVVFVVLVILLDTLEDTSIEGGSFKGTPLEALLSAVTMITQSVTSTISSWGYAGIFSLMLIEASSLPVPSEVILPFSGYLISQGYLNFFLTVLVSTLAGITGSLIDYYIGLKGINLLARRKVLDKLFFDKRRLEMAERWFNKYGAFVVFAGRMVPAFRTLISFPAGAVKMRLTKFIVYTAAGCLVWNAFLIYIGVYVGANWGEVAGVSRYIIIGFLAAVLVGLIVFLIRRRKGT